MARHVNFEPAFKCFTVSRWNDSKFNILWFIRWIYCSSTYTYLYALLQKISNVFAAEEERNALSIRISTITFRFASCNYIRFFSMLLMVHGQYTGWRGISKPDFMGALHIRSVYHRGSLMFSLDFSEWVKPRRISVTCEMHKMVTHPETKQAQLCFTSSIWRKLVHFWSFLWSNTCMSKVFWILSRIMNV